MQYWPGQSDSFPSKFDKDMLHPEIQAEIQLEMQAAFEFLGTHKKYACEGLIKPTKGAGI